MSLRASMWIAVIVMAGGGNYAAAQEQNNNPEEINRKYQDALVQLKASQDRKNELATENEQLKSKIAELQKKLDTANRDVMDIAEKTFQLRMQAAAWDAFLKRHPLLYERWKQFITGNPLAVPSSLPETVDVTAPAITE